MKIPFFLLIFCLTQSFIYVSAYSESGKNCLRIPIDIQLKDLDPGYIFSETSIELSENLFIGLTEVEFKNSICKAIPDLAEKWTLHENDTVYRFYLRKDVFWTKGITGQKQAPVTAHDIVWAIRRNINPKTDAPYAFVLYILKNAENIHTGKLKNISKIGVKAIDDYTVEFRLKHAAAYFPYLLSLWIFRPLPKETINKWKNKWTEPEHILSNGPFILKEWQKRKKIVLEKNPHFYNENQVSLSEIHFIIVQESFAGLHLYIENKLDVLGDGFLSLPLEKIPGIIKSDTYKNEFVSVPKLSGYSYLLNTLKSPLNNPLVRRALSLSINRKQLTVIITRCGEQAAKTFTPPSLFDISDIYSEKDFGIDFDPNKAKALLKQAGFPDGKNLPEITFLHSISENHFLIATAIQTFFKHYLNVSLKIEAKDWDEYNDIIFQSDRSKAPHITCLRWGSDYPDAYNWLNDAFLYAQGFTFWNNINFNQLVEKASRISNRNKRNNLYKKAEKILVFDEAVIIPLFFETGKYLIKPEIKQSSFTPICGQQLMRWKFGLNK